jgi:hypothetical protein
MTILVLGDEAKRMCGDILAGSVVAITVGSASWKMPWNCCKPQEVLDVFLRDWNLPSRRIQLVAGLARTCLTVIARCTCGNKL